MAGSPCRGVLEEDEGQDVGGFEKLQFIATIFTGLMEMLGKWGFAEKDHFSGSVGGDKMEVASYALPGPTWRKTERGYVERAVHA